MQEVFAKLKLTERPIGEVKKNILLFPVRAGLALGNASADALRNDVTRADLIRAVGRDLNADPENRVNTDRAVERAFSTLSKTQKMLINRSVQRWISRDPIPNPAPRRLLGSGKIELGDTTTNKKYKDFFAAGERPSEQIQRVLTDPETAVKLITAQMTRRGGPPTPRDIIDRARGIVFGDLVPAALSDKSLSMIDLSLSSADGGDQSARTLTVTAVVPNHDTNFEEARQLALQAAARNIQKFARPNRPAVLDTGDPTFRLLRGDPPQQPPPVEDVPAPAVSQPPPGGMVLKPALFERLNRGIKGRAQWAYDQGPQAVIDDYLTLLREYDNVTAGRGPDEDVTS